MGFDQAAEEISDAQSVIEEASTAFRLNVEMSEAVAAQPSCSAVRVACQTRWASNSAERVVALGSLWYPEEIIGEELAWGHNRPIAVYARDRAS